MLETTVKSLLAREVDTRGYRLYVIRDGYIVFYVGQGIDISNRLWQHLGQGEPPGTKSTVGEFLLLNRPRSGAYQVELFSAAEVLPGGSLASAEIKLIGDLSPCLNATYNNKPGKLPAHYKDPRSLDLNSTASDFIPF